MSATINADMRLVIENQRLCYAATVTPDGRPSLSPKGTLRVWDKSHLFFLDIASPRTRANLRSNPWIEINVVDPLSRRGYRFLGSAELHTEGAVYDAACRRIADDEGQEYPCDAVVLIAVDRILPVVSPGYAHVSSETEMREMYRTLRAERERAFDEHLAGG